MDWHNFIVHSDETIRQILKTSRTIAVVGIKDENHAHEAAHSVPAYLHSRGYKIIPVNPKYKSVFGIPTLNSLSEIDEPVDMVIMFRAPANVPMHVDEALRLKPKVLWMQTGIRNQEAAHKLAKHGIKVVQDHCAYMDHLRLIRAAA
jgi:predicted CoA-binding protein